MEFGKPVIFFDGVCGLCNGFVDFIIKRDRKDGFLFSPLQGETAAKFLPALSDSFQQWDIVYADEDGFHRASDATIKIVSKLGGIWAATGIFIFVPKFIRDALYRHVAANRYKWFGRWDFCRIPSEDEKSKFLP